MTLEERIKGKTVVFVPIFSMRNYKTGVYELYHDGNFSRICSLLAKSQHKKATVFVPLNHSLPDIKLPRTEFIPSKFYGKNAAETRESLSFITRITNLALKADVVVVEPNTLLECLYANIHIRDKLVYWCVASITSMGTPWFVEKYIDFDKKFAQLVDTACANQAQVEALKGRAYYEPSFYDAKLFDYKTIFFPFRLTDPSYRAKEFKLHMLEIMKDKSLPKFKVLYTDVNNSGLFDDIENFVKVSSDHDTYLQVLKGRPIIPYLEDDNVIEHISIHEFMYYHCELIMYTQKYKRDYPNIIYIKSLSELREALKTLFNKGEQQ